MQRTTAPAVIKSPAWVIVTPSPLARSGSIAAMPATAIPVTKLPSIRATRAAGLFSRFASRRASTESGENRPGVAGERDAHAPERHAEPAQPAQHCEPGEHGETDGEQERRSEQEIGVRDRQVP